MKIEDNYYYISELDKKLIDRGLASLDVHSVHLGGFHGEETAMKIKKIVDMLNGKFLIYQYEKKENGNYICSYSDNWDLFFWSNGNLTYPLTDTRLSFNENHRNYEERQKDLQRLIDILKEYEDESVTVKIQYKTLYHEEELQKVAEEAYDKLKNKFIYFNGSEGKIKPVVNYKDSYHGTSCNYGFFKKGSKGKYYQLTNMTIAEFTESKMLCDMSKKELCDILAKYDKNRTYNQLFRLPKEIIIGQINNYRKYN